MKLNRNDSYKTKTPFNDDFNINQWILSTERPEDEIFQIDSMNSDWLYDKARKQYDPDYCKVIVATSDSRLSNIHIISETNNDALAFAEWIELNCIRAGEHKWYKSADSTQKRYTTKEMFNFWQKN